MLTQIGGAIGLLFCLYSLVFRWKVVVARYGSLSLYWWVLAVTVGCSFLGYLADLAIWAVQYAIWRASY
jgi:hypothetical protein